MRSIKKFDVTKLDPFFKKNKFISKTSASILSSMFPNCQQRNNTPRNTKMEIKVRPTQKNKTIKKP